MGDEEIQSILDGVREVVLAKCAGGAESAFDAAGWAYRLEQQIRAIGLDCARAGLDSLVDSAPKGAGDKVDLSKLAGDQIARKLQLNCRQGHEYIALAEETRARLAPAYEALARGEIDYQKLGVLSRQCEGLTDDVTLAVQDHVLAEPPRCGATDFRRRAHRQVLRLDPRTAAERRRAAYQKRTVLYRTADDGQALLIIRGPAEELRPLYDRITCLAKATPKSGRELEQICYDVTRDLFHGGILATTGAAATLNVTVELDTLRGLNDNPAELDGHGPVPAGVAREIAAHPTTTLRRLTTVGGKLVHVSDRYRPTRSQAAYSRLRDTTCPWPGCNHPASSGDLDHGKPYRTTKITDTADLVGWCRRHHLLKTLGFFTWTRNANGSFTINLHDGTTFTTAEAAHA